MDIVRNADGILVVPLQERRHGTDDGGDASPDGAEGGATQTNAAPATRLLHPGEGGYDEALVEWDLQQNPDRAPVVSTATGREQAMTLVHAVATSPGHAVSSAVAALDNPQAGGEALRHYRGVDPRCPREAMSRVSRRSPLRTSDRASS